LTLFPDGPYLLVSSELVPSLRLLHEAGARVSESLEQEIRTLRSLFWSERDPEGRAFAPLADAYLRAGETKEALELLTDGISRHPDFTSGHVVAARLYLGQGMLGEAELSARQVLDLDRDNVLALESLVSVLEAGGDAEEAGRIGSRLAELDPDRVGSTSSSAEPGGVPPVVSPVSEDPAEDSRIDIAGIDTFDLGGSSNAGAYASDVGWNADDEVLTKAGWATESDLANLDGIRVAPTPELAESEPELEVMSLDDLAPDPEPEPELEVMSLEALAPDSEPELEVMSLDDLAPDPEPDVVSLDQLAPAAPAAKEPAAPVQTRTLAELYVKQGFVDKALDVLRQLHAKHPGADDIARRIDELERGAQELARASLHVQSASGDHDDEGGTDADLDAAADGDDGDEMEALARDMAEGSAEHEVDTPFAWTESDAADEPGTAAGGPRIGDYFDGLLAWEERDES
jgi:tetratricopeptide (TPR) repeat protein